MITEQKLTDYVQAGLATREIAKRFGVSQTTIIRRLKTYGLKTEPVRKDGSLRKLGQPRPKSIERYGNCARCGTRVKTAGATYCSIQCSSQHRADLVYIDWKNGLNSGTQVSGELLPSIKRRLKEEYDNTCPKCGFRGINPYNGSVILDIHHIDGDWRNNSPTNVSVLCPNCHRMTENHGSLNHSGSVERPYMQYRDNTTGRTN